MLSPIEVVTAFCEAFPEDAGRPAVRKWFTPETHWVNEGLSVTDGVDEAVALLDQLVSTMGITSLKIEILSIAADGSRVLTERIDRFERADGTEIGSTQMMGIFEVEGDKIVAWRDYFDTNLIQKFTLAE